jgi:mRNA-degrading endonuclease toxin of MazEF toxin-antitoxin module
VVALEAVETGLPRRSYGLGHQVTTLDRSKLTESVGGLGEASMRRVETAVLAACGIDIAAER